MGGGPSPQVKVHAVSAQVVVPYHGSVTTRAIVSERLSETEIGSKFEYDGVFIEDWVRGSTYSFFRMYPGNVQFDAAGLNYTTVKASGEFPVVIVLHNTWPSSYGEKPNWGTTGRYDSSDGYLGWLKKLVRYGFIVVLLEYGGSSTTPYMYDTDLPFHPEGDQMTVRDFLDSGYTGVGRRSVIGLGFRGGSLAMYAGLHNAWAYAFNGAIISMNGTPNLGCSLQRWPDLDELNIIKERIYNSFGGSPEDNPAVWYNSSPGRFGPSDIDDIALGDAYCVNPAANLLQINTEYDSLSHVRDVYEFHTQLLNRSINSHCYIYKNVGPGYLFERDDKDWQGSALVKPANVKPKDWVPKVVGGTPFQGHVWQTVLKFLLKYGK